MSDTAGAGVGGWIFDGVLGYHLDGGLVVFLASRGSDGGEHGVFGRLLGLEKDGRWVSHQGM